MDSDKLKKANDLTKEIDSLKRTVKHIENNDHHNYTLAPFELKITLPTLKQALIEKEKEFESL